MFVKRHLFSNSSILLVPFISLILLFSCNSTKPFTAYQLKKDQFEPDKLQLYSSSIKIEGIKMLSAEWACFTINFSGIVSSTTSTNLSSLLNRWYIVTDFGGYDWSFINELKFAVDDKVFTYYSSPNPSREVYEMFSSVRISETNIFYVDESLFQSLKSANKASVRLSGKTNMDRNLTSDDIHNIVWFYDYVNGRLSAKE